MNLENYCVDHRNYYADACIGCINDTFHTFGLYHNTVEELKPEYTWDETWGYIYDLPMSPR